MPEKPSEKPQFSLHSSLLRFSAKWRTCEDQERLKGVIELYLEAKGAGYSRENFMAVIKEIFSVSGQTAIQMWLQSYEIHGLAFVDGLIESARKRNPDRPKNPQGQNLKRPTATAEQAKPESIKRSKSKKPRKKPSIKDEDTSDLPDPNTPEGRREINRRIKKVLGPIN